MTTPLIEPWVPIEGPRVTPYGNGLMSAAQSVELVDHGLWESGVTWRIDHCSQGGIWPAMCIPITEGHSKTGPIASNVQPHAVPFVITDDWSCMAPTNVPGAGQRARNRLENSQQGLIEKTVWNGAGGNWPYLSSSDAIDLTPSTGAVPLSQGIGKLEQELACRGGIDGVLHMPRRLVSPLAALQQFVPGGTGGLRTWNGNRVAAYGCPDTQGPGGVEPASDDESWIYATGPIRILWSEIMTPGGQAAWLDRTRNILTAIAERTVLVMWDCPQLAIRVDNRAAVAMSGFNAITPAPDPEPTVLVTASLSDPANTRVASAVVSGITDNRGGTVVHWGDGTTTVLTGTPAEQTVTHVYGEPGEYVITVMVADRVADQTSLTVPAVTVEWRRCPDLGHFRLIVSNVTGTVIVEMSQETTKTVTAAGSVAAVTYHSGLPVGWSKKTAKITVPGWSETSTFYTDVLSLPVSDCSLPPADSAPAVAELSGETP